MNYNNGPQEIYVPPEPVAIVPIVEKPKPPPPKPVEPKPEPKKVPKKEPLLACRHCKKMFDKKLLPAHEAQCLKPCKFCGEKMLQHLIPPHEA